MQGLILLDKPQGITSFGAAAALRRLCGEKRIGHTGTLDPMATGVLPILLGQATRLSSVLITAEKRYTATVKLGLTSDTLDITGKLLSTCDVNISPDEFEAALQQFRGEISQLPPMYSAIKKDGVRLYSLARQGVEVERTPRNVTIKELELIEALPDNEYVIDVLCSKGTYIRSLADDIGKALGCGAVLTSLRRTMTAGFSIDECTPLEKFEENGAQKYILPADRAVMHLGEVRVSQPQGVRFCNGGGLSLSRLSLSEDCCDEALLRVYAPGGFLGLGKINLQKDMLTVFCVIGGKELCSQVK